MNWYFLFLILGAFAFHTSGRTTGALFPDLADSQQAGYAGQQTSSQQAGSPQTSSQQTSSQQTGQQSGYHQQQQQQQTGSPQAGQQAGSQAAGSQQAGSQQAGSQAGSQSLAPTVPCDSYLTTDQGIPVNDDQNSLKAGERGPTLIEDFLFREKMTHFDHERIPERVVHARGSAAHGYFQVYQSMAQYTRAQFLQDPSVQTPVFVRFSTVSGSKGSADTVRDVRGFATKFYTQEGNFDLVGNNMPVFFIQDAIKFPDLIHSAKPEQDWGIPQASTAHDTFYDFISLTPESMHMIMWVESDRALPRSFSTMEGFGVHTFRFVNAAGNSTYVKFHWKPVKGLASFVWEEAQHLTGADPDFLRRDLWNSIAQGDYPEWEFGVQLLGENEVSKVQFDILDATKIWPEEIVPVQKIGKMTLNRNPDNFHDETEQVAFHTGNLVAGIDVTDDPLLQGRLFSYLDTQLLRLGGPNFHEIPINQAVAPVANNQRGGWKRHTKDKGKVSYFPNSLAGGCPMQAAFQSGGYVSFPERVNGPKVRQRAASFSDYYCQATLFWNSMTSTEQNHIINAFEFELGHVNYMHIKSLMVDHLNHINNSLACAVAQRIGLPSPAYNGSNACRQQFSSKLSIELNKVAFLTGKNVAILASPSSVASVVAQVQNLLNASGVNVKVISTVLGNLPNSSVAVNATYLIASSVQFDAAVVIGPNNLDAARHFVRETYRHSLAIGTIGAGDLVNSATECGMTLPSSGKVVSKNGVVIADAKADVNSFWSQFKPALEQYRFWVRENTMEPYAD